MITLPTPCLRFFKPTTLLVVVYENICGNFFFLYLCCPLDLAYPPTLLCVSLLRNKELGESVIVQNHLHWEEVGGELGRLTTKTLKTRETRQSHQGSVGLLLSLPLNFAVGFLLSFC